MGKQITNLSGYRFVLLADRPLETWRAELKEKCKSLELKGTIILSPEGINLMVSGKNEAASQFKDLINSFDDLRGIELKESQSTYIPFTKMLVKLKPRLIPIDGPQPESVPQNTISGEELDQWYASGKSFTIVDTRNSYETRLGKFKNAVDPGISKFKEFPEYFENTFPKDRDEPVVTYCTGGIRCEKLLPYLRSKGYSNVYQLDGGILTYFEKTKGQNWEGECFVFDYRTTVDPSLEEGDVIQCFVCREPLTREEQEDHKFLLGKSCPYCFDETG